MTEDFLPRFMTWAEVRPASSYVRRPRGCSPYGCKVFPLTDTSMVKSFHAPINRFRTEASGSCPSACAATPMIPGNTSRRFISLLPVGTRLAREGVGVEPRRNVSLETNGRLVGNLETIYSR